MSESIEHPAAIPDGHTSRRLETRRRLIAAGTELFAEGGLHAVTTTAIARRAGVATGTFYLHYPDKHALFEELVESALEELRGPRSAGEGLPRSDAERRSRLAELLRRAEERRDLIRAVFERGVESSAIAERIHQRVAGWVEPEYARRAEEEGLAIHPAAAAQARAAVLIRVIGWWVEDPSRATREQIVETLLQVDPLRRPGAGPAPDSH